MGVAYAVVPDPARPYGQACFIDENPAVKAGATSAASHQRPGTDRRRSAANTAAPANRNRPGASICQCTDQLVEKYDGTIGSRSGRPSASWRAFTADSCASLIARMCATEA